MVIFTQNFNRILKMIKRFHEHSFRTDLIVPGGWGIDFGCGTDFFVATDMLELGLNVIAVDPNPAIKSVPNVSNLYFERAALATSSGNIELKTYNDNDAASVMTPKNDVSYLRSKEAVQVSCVTIEDIMLKYNIDEFEILKLDIEGAEYEFLMSLKKPIAKQISVEFHDFRGLNPFYPDNEKYYDALFEKLSKWYTIEKHIIEQHPGLDSPACYNYWDSLFVRR